MMMMMMMMMKMMMTALKYAYTQLYFAINAVTEKQTYNVYIFKYTIIKRKPFIISTPRRRD